MIVVTMIVVTMPVLTRSFQIESQSNLYDKANAAPLPVVAEFAFESLREWQTDCLDRRGLIEIVKPSIVIVWLLIVLAVLNGCDTEQAQRPTYDPDAQVVISKDEYTRLRKTGRFQPFNEGMTGIALDTSTGQVCKTHDWHHASSEPLCPKNGMITEPCVMERSPYENAPLCTSLP
jgi:hypothetical protein